MGEQLCPGGLLSPVTWAHHDVGTWLRMTGQGLPVVVGLGLGGSHVHRPGGPSVSGLTVLIPRHSMAPHEGWTWAGGTTSPLERNS